MSAAQQEAERAAEEAAAKQDLLDTVNAELPLIRQQASCVCAVAAVLGACHGLTKADSVQQHWLALHALSLLASRPGSNLLHC